MSRREELQAQIARLQEELKTLVEPSPHLELGSCWFDGDTWSIVTSTGDNGPRCFHFCSLGHMLHSTWDWPCDPSADERKTPEAFRAAFDQARLLLDRHWHEDVSPLLAAQGA